MQRRHLLSIIATGLLAALSALPVAAQEPPKLPDGMVGIHYFRPDGNYNGWGVHLWESFDKVENGKITGPKAKGDQSLPGVSWMTPMMPSGKSDLGVYWHIKADEFRNTKVNYIIHKGDTKDQCGKDMFFSTTQGKEIFVNAGDCNIYFSKDEALKARK